MKRKILNTDFGNVIYWISDKKEKCVFFSHGLTADHTLFDKQVDVFSKEYTVITWDMPLHGESADDPDFTFKRAAECMYRILSHEGIEKTTVIGQSAGGYAAQAFAMFYPEMTECFISIGSTPFGSRYYKKSELFWVNHFSELAMWYPYNYYCKVSAKSVAQDEESRQSFYNSLQKLGKRRMLQAGKLLYRDFSKYDEVDFKCKVLLTIGENDNTGYIKKYTKMWVENTGYTLVTIPNARHNANYDNYEFFNELVLSFLKRELGN